MNQAQKEERRNIFWKVLIVISSVLLLAIGAYFVFQLFTGNPLEGTWSYEDSNLLMTIQKDDRVKFTLPDQFDGGSVTVEMVYEVDVNTKVLTLHMVEEAVERAAGQTDGAVSASEIENVISALEGAYDYNIEQNQLTLTEREYGEQMIFDKQ